LVPRFVGVRYSTVRGLHSVLVQVACVLLMTVQRKKKKKKKIQKLPSKNF